MNTIFHVLSLITVIREPFSSREGLNRSLKEQIGGSVTVHLYISIMLYESFTTPKWFLVERYINLHIDMSVLYQLLILKDIC